MNARHTDLWDAINHYTETCGGDTSSRTVSEDRINAVVAVEDAAGLIEIEQLRSELERVKRQNAAMADALRKCHTALHCEGDEPWRIAVSAINAAAKDDAGRDYIAKESVRPLVEALETVLNSAMHPDVAVRALMVSLEPVRNALNHAHQLGLLEDGK